MKNNAQCTECEYPLLETTVEEGGDTYLPCLFLAELRGRSPNETEAILRRDDGLLEEDWQTFRSTRFPNAYGGIDVAGICVTMLDSDAAGCVSSYLLSGSLDDERIRVLQGCERMLLRVIPELPAQPASYFESLLSLVTRVLANSHNSCSTKSS